MNKWVAFADVLKYPIRNGLTKPKAIRGEGVKMIAMGEIFAKARIADIEMDRVPVTEKEMTNCGIEEGDLLFARQSLVLEGAGKCSIVTEVTEPTVFESHLIRARIDENKADILFLERILGKEPSSEEEYVRYVEEVEKFYRITGFEPHSTAEQFADAYVRYGAFLWSPYHDLLPYIWIRANLWAHLMQRQNSIKQGDNLDVQWAAAYLPYVDYAVTDHAFCTLLNSSGLAKQYGTKVYSFRTLRDLLEELKQINT